MEKEVGVIKSIDDTNKKVYFYGYGEYIGNCVVPNNILESQCQFTDIEICAPKIKFKNNNEIWVTSGWFSDKESMEHTLSSYIKDGYTIINI